MDQRSQEKQRGEEQSGHAEPAKGLTLDCSPSFQATSLQPCGMLLWDSNTRARHCRQANIFLTPQQLTVYQQQGGKEPRTHVSVSGDHLTAGVSCCTVRLSTRHPSLLS